MAVAVRNPHGALSDPELIVAPWRERIKQAREARRPNEKVWLSNLAFARGQHWLVWDDVSKQLRHVQSVDPKQKDRELYTADRITEYLLAEQGELNADDDRPELLTAQDGDSAEEIARELNLAVAHAWDHESGAVRSFKRSRRSCLVMGVSVLRAKYDATKGPVTDRQPVDATGKPVADEQALAFLEQSGTLPDGSLPKFKMIHEGRSVIEPYTAFQTLTPPGVVHEDDFPWEILARPVPLDGLKDEYGAAADGLSEDGDIASAAGLSTGQTVAGTGTSPQVKNARLRDHVWLYTCFKRPCHDYPNGQTVVLASNDFRLLEVKEELPYKLADGTPHSGIVYLHWQRLDDSFWSRAFIEGMKDPQRLINERKTQNAEIIARGMPKVFVEEGAIIDPDGTPMEKVELKKDTPKPDFHGGVGPGGWMYQDIATLDEDLAHASTLGDVRLGENPQNVDTYSQLVVLNENESRKREMILSDHRDQRDRLVELLAHDIREMWPESKMILVSGEEDSISRQEFQKSRVPDFYMVKTASGPAAPRSQAAEIKKIDAIWAAASAAGLTVTDPDSWTRWYADSLNAGEALELPEAQKDSQERFAEYENFLIQSGEVPLVDDYDLLPIHLPIHRELMDQARAAGDVETYARAKGHVDLHEQSEMQKAAQINSMQPAPPPVEPPPGQKPAAGPPTP